MKKITKAEAWEILKTKTNALETVLNFSERNPMRWGDILYLKLDKIMDWADNEMLDSSVLDRTPIKSSSTYIQFIDGSKIYFNSFHYRFTYKNVLVLVNCTNTYTGEFAGKLIVYTIK